MIVPVTIGSSSYMAVAMPEVSNVDDVRDLRSSLMDLLEACVGNDDSKTQARSNSLRMLVRMIDALTTTVEEGG